MKSILFAYLFFFTLSSVFSQDIDPVKGYFKNNFVFESGYWVYQDTSNADIDSISLTSCIHNYVSPNPGWPDYQEYYLMDYHSHTNNYDYNDYIITNYWKRNGGGYYGELGQPIMHIGQYQQLPEVGNGFNGYEIITIINELEIAGNIFYGVVVSRIYVDEQYQNEFFYDTDLYFAPDVGIIRKEYTDSNEVKHVWDLIDWQTNIYTGIKGGVEEETALIYPNPARTFVVVKCKEVREVQIFDAYAKLMLSRECSSDEIILDVKDVLLPGLYFLKITSDSGIFLKKVIIN